LNVVCELCDPFGWIVEKLQALSIIVNLKCSMREGNTNEYAYFWLYVHGLIIFYD
jgi:hypothetical protein